MCSSLLRRKFGAAVVIANVVVYVLFLLLLMAMVVVFPAYSPRPLHNQDSLERLLVYLAHLTAGSCLVH